MYSRTYRTKLKHTNMYTTKDAYQFETCSRISIIARIGRIGDTPLGSPASKSSVWTVSAGRPLQSDSTVDD